MDEDLVVVLALQRGHEAVVAVQIGGVVGQTVHDGDVGAVILFHHIGGQIVADLILVGADEALHVLPAGLVNVVVQGDDGDAG